MRTKLGKLQHIQIENAIRNAWMRGYYKGREDGVHKVINFTKPAFEKLLLDAETERQRQWKHWGEIDDLDAAKMLCDKLDKFLTPKVKK